jgi:hypothetical protein
MICELSSLPRIHVGLRMMAVSAHHGYATVGIAWGFGLGGLGMAVSMRMGGVGRVVADSNWDTLVSCRCGNLGEGAVACCCKLSRLGPHTVVHRGGWNSGQLVDIAGAVGLVLGWRRVSDGRAVCLDEVGYWGGWA